MPKRVNHKPVALLVFDGTVYDYDKYGWKGIDNLNGEPLEGAKEAIEELKEKYEVYLYSDRFTQPSGKEAVEYWLEDNNIEVEGIVFQPIPHFVFIGTKMKKFPRRWKKDFIEELKSISPKD